MAQMSHGETIALTIYAIEHAFGAVTAMSDLVWQANWFEANRLWPPGDVVVIGERG